MTVEWTHTATQAMTQNMTLGEMAFRLGSVTAIMVGVLYLAYFFLKKYPQFQQAAQFARSSNTSLNPTSTNIQHQAPKKRTLSNGPLQWISVFRKSITPTLSTLHTKTTPSIIQLSERTSLSDEQELAVITVKGTELLLHITPTHTSCLHVLSEPQQSITPTNKFKRGHQSVQHLTTLPPEPEWQINPSPTSAPLPTSTMI